MSRRRKLQVPKTFRLGGRLWHQQIKENVVGSDGEQCWGTADTDTCTIELDSLHATQAGLEATSIHERIEAANQHYQMELTHKQIELLEVALHEILITSRGYLKRGNNSG